MGILRDKQNNNNKKPQKKYKKPQNWWDGSNTDQLIHLLTQRLPRYGKLMEEGKIDTSSPANLKKISMQQGTM